VLPSSPPPFPLCSALAARLLLLLPAVVVCSYVAVYEFTSNHISVVPANRFYVVKFWSCHVRFAILVILVIDDALQSHMFLFLE